MRALVVPLAAALLFTMVPASARESDVARDMRVAARAFLDTLGASARSTAALPFDSDERLNWHFVPKMRKGLPLYAMTPQQRSAAMALLKTGLSASGFKKTETIRSLENVLFEIEGPPARVAQPDGRPRRDQDRYHVTIFGTPGDPHWGWRFEGHHISQNWTIVGGTAISSTPQFLGANPAEVRTGPLTGTRALAAEEDLARTFLASLDPEQKKAAVVTTDAPDDILTFNQREAGRLEHVGVAWRQLSAGQQRLLWKVIEEYAHTQAPNLARARLERVKKDGLDDVKFAWMGGLEKGQRHYYRVQGPSFVIEYDNTQNDANHIHAVWRDFNGDFGRDLLGEHLRSVAH